MTKNPGEKIVLTLAVLNNNDEVVTKYGVEASVPPNVISDGANTYANDMGALVSATILKHYGMWSMPIAAE